MVKFKRNASTYDSIACFIDDYLDYLGVADKECIVTMRYDDNEETENVLFVDHGDEMFTDLHPTTDFLEDQTIIYILGIRTIQNPDKFIEVEVGDSCAEE